MFTFIETDHFISKKLEVPRTPPPPPFSYATINFREFRDFWYLNTHEIFENELFAEINTPGAALHVFEQGVSHLGVRRNPQHF